MQIEILCIRPARAEHMEDYLEVYVAWAFPDRETAMMGDEGIDWLFLGGSDTEGSLPHWNLNLLRRIINELVPRREEY